MSQVNWWLTGIFIFAVIAAVSAVIVLILRTYKQKVTTGKEDLKGRIALVRQTLEPEGTVFVDGELWNAVSQSGRVEIGQEVVILDIKGLTLKVSIKTKE